MAIQQTITATKAGGTFADMDEANVAYGVSANASDLKDVIDAAETNGDFVRSGSFDAETQTLTLIRTWNEDAWNAYVAANGTERPSAQANLEADGWTVSQSIGNV